MLFFNTCIISIFTEIKKTKYAGIQIYKFQMAKLAYAYDMQASHSSLNSEIKMSEWFGFKFKTKKWIFMILLFTSGKHTKSPVWWIHEIYRSGIFESMKVIAKQTVGGTHSGYQNSNRVHLISLSEDRRQSSIPRFSMPICLSNSQYSNSWTG